MMHVYSFYMFILIVLLKLKLLLALVRSSHSILQNVSVYYHYIFFKHTVFVLVRMSLSKGSIMIIGQIIIIGLLIIDSDSLCTTYELDLSILKYII